MKNLNFYVTFFIRNTLMKKEARAFRNIGKNISLYCVISLANFRFVLIDVL